MKKINEKFKQYIRTLKSIRTTFKKGTSFEDFCNTHSEKVRNATEARLIRFFDSCVNKNNIFECHEIFDESESFIRVKSESGESFLRERNGLVVSSLSNLHSVREKMNILIIEATALAEEEKELINICDLYKAYQPIVDVKILGYADDNFFCYTKLPFKQAEIGVTNECPTYRTILDNAREQSGRAFAAFVHIVLNPQIKNHQILLVRGGGGNGKSFLVSKLSSILSTSAQSLPSDDKKSLSVRMNGCRLGLFADAVNTSILTSEIILNASGGDEVSCNPKFEKPYSYRPNIKLVFVTNKKFAFQDSRAVKRRMLIVDFDDSSLQKIENIDKKLDEELLGFLGYCKECFEELWSEDENKIIAPVDLLSEAIDDYNLKFETLFDGKHLTILKEGRLRKSVLMKIAQDLKLDRNEVFDWLLKQPGIKLVKTGNVPTLVGVAEYNYNVHGAPQRYLRVVGEAEVQGNGDNTPANTPSSKPELKLLKLN